MTACASCGVSLGALTEEEQKRLDAAAEKADKAFAAAYAEAQKNAANLRLRLSTTTKLTGTNPEFRKMKNAFAIPAGPKFSCPGATRQCSGCYAREGRFIASDQRKFYAENWARWRYLEDLVGPNGEPQPQVAALELINVIKRSPTLYGFPPAFRLWESGDFHSQWSVDVWTLVMQNLPQISFWGYTRSFMLDFSRIVRLPNFMLWASTDHENYQKATAFVQKYPSVRPAYWWDPLVPAPSGSVVCPATQPEQVNLNPDALRARKPEYFKVQMRVPLDGFPEQGYAPGACGTCRYCLPGKAGGLYGNARKTSVTFFDHDMARDFAVVETYKRLKLFAARGEANLYTKGRTEEVEETLKAAHKDIQAKLEAEQARRAAEKAAAKKLDLESRGTGLKGLGQTVEKGLVDGCMYIYGREDHFPG